MIEMTPLQFIGYLIIGQTVILVLWIRGIDDTLRKILKKLESGE